jgi:alpha-mannosidase
VSLRLIIQISWNNINVFPYNTFNWAGIDGSQVLAHMTPVDQYNGQCTLWVNLCRGQIEY